MRGFSDEERARIRRGLLETGREQFARYGLKKTTIADLTDPVGIANSTFYRFFDSKEALYAEILQSLEEEIAESIVRDSLESTGLRGVVVDLRWNGGGNNGLVRPLIRQLVAWEVSGDGRRIVVLAGRHTFSAAQNLANRLERWTEAVFVGEPTGSRPNVPGERTELVLPWSGLRASISNRYWQDSDPGDERPWIAPDVRVEPSADEYFAGRDPVLEAVLELLEEPEPER